ncbi:MAG: hypothetical protein AAF568_08240, partial [Pseudomonadota bacterium]
MPTEYWLAGGAVAVGFTFLVLALGGGSEAAFRARRLGARAPLGGEAFTQWVGFLLFLALLYAGFTGPGDPAVNPLPLAVWTVGWIGLTLVTALCGDLWRAINPWSGPHRLLRRYLGPVQPLPAFGHWPAVACLFLIGWVELVYPAPEDPTRLGLLLIGYWSFHLAAMALWGEPWRERCEGLSLFFSLIARLAPVWAERTTVEGRARLTWFAAYPGGRLIRDAPLPLSGTAFLTLALAVVSFDGLLRTFAWIDLMGVNPFEYPGRTAMVELNSLGLLGAWAGMSTLFVGAVLGGRALARPETPWQTDLGRLALTLLPIALGYHLGH